jgi:hypothetical protein
MDNPLTELTNPCTLPNFYERDASSGRCVAKACNMRTPDGSQSKHCGPDYVGTDSASSACYWDPQNTAVNGGKCSFAVDGCVKSGHYEVDTRNVCIMKTDCIRRTVLGLDTVVQYPCGSTDCIGDVGHDSNACVLKSVGCTNNSFWKPDPAVTGNTYMCTLRECETRSARTRSVLFGYCLN